MSNTNKVIDMIAKEALRVAHEKATFIGSINRSYDDSFSKSGAKIGSTLRVRDPNQYTRRQGSRIMNVQDQNSSMSPQWLVSSISPCSTSTSWEWIWFRPWVLPW